jgi:hypothetical protein
MQAMWRFIHEEEEEEEKRREEFYIMKWFSVFSIKGILSLLLPLFSDCKVL